VLLTDAVVCVTHKHMQDNVFSEMPYTPGSQAGGNGFASFGSPRKSERVSYSRNVYRGQFNSNNSPDGSFPHEVRAKRSFPPLIFNVENDHFPPRQVRDRHGDSLKKATAFLQAFSSDGTGGAYAGLLHSADTSSVSVPGSANGGYVGGAVAILNGKGRGQVSKIASVVNPPP
jgi:hypothetical protein